jgi:membrane-associated protease RseP (regulator of RpoE activity)
MKYLVAVLLLSSCGHYTSHHVQAMIPHDGEVLVLAIRTTTIPGVGTGQTQTVNACELDKDNDRLACRAIGIEFDAQLPMLGISYQDNEGGGPGAVITSVKEGGFAAAAGVLAGDVVVELNSKAIADRATLRAALAAAGKSLTLTVVRAGEKLELRATRSLAARTKL